jgi:hypothetical protein
LFIALQKSEIPNQTNNGNTVTWQFRQLQLRPPGKGKFELADKPFKGHFPFVGAAFQPRLSAVHFRGWKAAPTMKIQQQINSL